MKQSLSSMPGIAAPAHAGFATTNNENKVIPNQPDQIYTGLDMRRCDRCGHARAYELADGRFKCKACGQRYTWTTAWASIRLAEATKRRLLELFVLGVPVYRQRFRAPASAPTIERFYRLVRACCAHVEGHARPFEGAIECDETTIGGARAGERGWGAGRQGVGLGVPRRDGQGG